MKTITTCIFKSEKFEEYIFENFQIIILFFSNGRTARNLKIVSENCFLATILQKDESSVGNRVSDDREDTTKNGISNVEVAIDDETYNVKLKEDIDISDERWDEEGKYLFEWTRNLSLDNVNLRQHSPVTFTFSK